MAQVQQRVLITALALVEAGISHAAKFYPDDPLKQAPAPVRVETARRRKLNDQYDFFLNTFARPGEKHGLGRFIPAGAVNTLGEAPDSEWYTNRHGYRAMSMEELVRGPGDANPPSADGPWKIIESKLEGITPGFKIEDARGNLYMLKFDPRTNPEMATAADVIGSKFFHALGYNVPENYLVQFPRRRLVLGKRIEIRDAFGKRRTLSERDVDEVLMTVPREPDGSLRAVASRYLTGALLREFRFHGTRRDDPNDVVRHEHRRDLRGLFVFCAWLGHDDSRAINTLDVLVDAGPLRYVKHYLVDFGSILGSASTKANSARSGNEHLFTLRSSAIEFLSLGFFIPRWARADFPHLPAVGRFESKVFDPEKYRPEYPNPAFRNRLPDDTFWAARQVMRFRDGEIRAIVRAGQYSDPRAEDWIVQCLIERRDKIGRSYFSKVLPLDDFRIRDGQLEFEDLAAKYGFRPPPKLSVEWTRFDNDAERHTPLEGETSFRLPRELATAALPAYYAASIRGDNRAQAVQVYVRKTGAGVEVVGVERTW